MAPLNLNSAATHSNDTGNMILLEVFAILILSGIGAVVLACIGKGLAVLYRRGRASVQQASRRNFRKLEPPCPHGGHHNLPPPAPAPAQDKIWNNCRPTNPDALPRHVTFEPNSSAIPDASPLHVTFAPNKKPTTKKPASLYTASRPPSPHPSARAPVDRARPGRPLTPSPCHRDLPGAWPVAEPEPRTSRRDRFFAEATARGFDNPGSSMPKLPSPAYHQFGRRVDNDIAPASERGWAPPVGQEHFEMCDFSARDMEEVKGEESV